MKQDIRWEQRFSNYNKALRKMTEAVRYVTHHSEEETTRRDSTNRGNVLDDLIKEALIKRFEYTYELAWNVMKDYAHHQGMSNIASPRDAIRVAFQLHLIKDGKLWMDMIGSRNATSHTYHQAKTDGIYHKIIHEYYPAFVAFQRTMETKKTAEHNELL